MIQIPENIDWDLLRTFNICSRVKTFAAAAKFSGAQPSAVGKQMKRLENFLGCRLFERVNDNATNRLTKEGEALLRKTIVAENFLFNKQQYNPFEDLEVKEIFIKGAISNASLGGKKYINTIYSLTVDGINIVFLGALGDANLSKETREITVNNRIAMKIERTD